MKPTTPTTRAATALAVLATLTALLLSGCLLEPFTGAEVILELGTSSANSGDIANRPAEHYELFAEIHGGLVSVGKFRIDENLNAVAFPSGEKIGAANQLGEGLPESGIRFRTEVNLEDAEQVLITIEDNGETDLAPSERIIGRSVLLPGPRSALVGDIEGEVPTVLGKAPLVSSRVAILLTDDRVYF